MTANKRNLSCVPSSQPVEPGQHTRRCLARRGRWYTAMTVTAAVLCAAAPPAPAQSAADEPWLVHDSFEDFIQGAFEDAGVNTFVARDGGVQMIHRWDLNNDGYLDLMVGQSHNTVEQPDALIYWGTPHGPVSLMPPRRGEQPMANLLNEVRSRWAHATPLPTAGGGRCLVEDLNADGHPDIVFCNYMHNSAVEAEAYIYWGHDDGYSPARRTELLTHRALAVAAADFNGDGFIDLAFANNGNESWSRFGHDKHEVSFIYWNGPTGFSEDRRLEVPIPRASDCVAADLDGDGRAELVITGQQPGQACIKVFTFNHAGDQARELARFTRAAVRGVALIDVNADGHLDLVAMRTDNTAEVLPGSRDGFAEQPILTLEVAGASQCRATDLNRDGHVDLVFPNSASDGKTGSWIYFGSSDGFSRDRRIELPTLRSHSVTIADFDADGWPDLFFTNEFDDKTYDLDSYVFWNREGRFDPADRDGLFGFGPISSAAGDLNGDGHQDLLLINHTSGGISGNDASPGSLVYWGNASHRYSDAAVTHLPTTADTMAMADFNLDGFVDIAYPNGHVYWGAADGYSDERRVSLDIDAGNGVTTADINRDGYLDLLIPGGSGHGDDAHAWGRIYFGDGKTFSREYMAEMQLTVLVPQSVSVADLNRDGHLDLVYPDVDSKAVDFFWGDETGTFTNHRRTSIEAQNASTVEIADLNDDGWLDLVFGGTYDTERKGRQSRFGMILFGGLEGYDAERSQTFEAYDANEQAIADLNKDGYLDLVTSNYHGYTTRTVPVFIYWGDPSGTYNELRRSMLPGESSLRLTVLDFDADGWLDIAVFNHQQDGNHAYGTMIYYGGEEGYDSDRSQRVQSFGVHFGDRHDLGNIYRRELEESYISMPIQISDQAGSAMRLDWLAESTHGTTIRFQVRSSPTAEGLDVARWYGSDSEAEYFDHPGSLVNIKHPGGWMQYRAVLVTPDGGSTPILRRVEISRTVDTSRNE